eukprot:COSAG06_NODE_8578_length_2125_cov_2.188549_1_plen_43_part_10
MATEMSVDEYHQATRAHEVDILAGVMPRRRRSSVNTRTTRARR